MAREVAGYAYWISTLVESCGIHVRSELPREKRRLFRELARLLLANEFDDVGQLGSSPDPGKWVGADAFTHDDLDVVRNMISRHAGHAFFHRFWCLR